jgi:CubicO group peptidase (beta-lactamase class C family)
VSGPHDLQEDTEKPMNHKQKKTIRILGIMLIFPLSILSFWRFRMAAPKKPDPIPLGDYAYTLDYTEYRIHQLMKRHHLPSLAVALVDDQNVIWQGAFGWADIEKEIPATTDTVYKLWSVAKVFTAIETMRLVEDGLVDLDAPISDYLPNFSIQSRFPDTAPVTIRSILAHHSGLPRNECHWTTFRPEGQEMLGELVESLKDCHMTSTVGSRYKYSNIGPDALGALIQELRGESFPSYMKESLLIPTGMENSVYLSADISPQKNVALGYEYYKGEHYPYEQGDITSLPSGNLYSTIEDMNTFVKFIFRGGEANGEQIINPETLTLMFEDQYSSQKDPQPMGLGWKITNVFGSELLVWHDGGPIEGIGSLVALLPERKLGVVLFANEVSFEGNLSLSLGIEILERMLETKYGIIPTNASPPESVAIDRSLLDDYDGKYIVFGQVLDISLSGDQLKVDIQGVKVGLSPVSQTKFRMSHWLLDLGLADLFRLPIDPRELEIEFLVGVENDDDVMIINFGNIVYEIFPRYPEVKEVPPLWKELSGDYELVGRTSSESIGVDVLGNTSIWVEDGVLQVAGFVGPILPISESEIIILSGSFAGETMIYEQSTGYIYHQSIVYKPSGD